MPFTPSDAGDACIRRSRRLLALSEEDVNDKKVRSDLRRSAIVMAVAGIDAYLHWLVYQRVSKTRDGDVPKAFANLDVPFTDLVGLAKSTIAGRQKKVPTRPWVNVKHAMQKRLFKETFQSYDQVSNAFAWAGVERGWTKVAKEMAQEPDEVKKRLNALVHRRNQIVHEGDIKRALRPRALKYNEIDHAAVVAEVDWVEKLLVAFERALT